MLKTIFKARTASKFQNHIYQCKRSFAVNEPQHQTKKITKTKIFVPEANAYYDFEAELTRDFIYDSLYNPDYGYFNLQGKLIFSQQQENVKLEEEKKQVHDDDAATSFSQKILIPFNSLQNEAEYKSFLSKLYSKEQHAWSTPCEIFQPFYAESLAKYMLSKLPYFQENQLAAAPPLVIYEVGGGNGTCAKGVLDYIQRVAPQVYETVEYHVIEISKTLHTLQVENLKEQHAKHFTSHLSSIFDWKKIEDRPCFFIALEVLDNMPHDKIWLQEDGLFETHVVYNEEAKMFEEKLVDLNDPLIVQYLSLINVIENQQEEGEEIEPNNGKKVITPSPSLYNSHEDARPSGSIFSKLFGAKNKDYFTPSWLSAVGGYKAMYIPTCKLQMFHALKKYFPLHHAIIADFDRLPREEAATVNSPVTQQKRFNQQTGEYVTVSFKSYLVPRGTCDIFFATDFAQMQQVYSKLMKERRGSVVMKQSQFLEKYCDSLNKMETQNGYNPALEDYTNMSFFLS